MISVYGTWVKGRFYGHGRAMTNGARQARCGEKRNDGGRGRTLCTCLEGTKPCLKPRFMSLGVRGRNDVRCVLSGKRISRRDEVLRAGWKGSVICGRKRVFVGLGMRGRNNARRVAQGKRMPGRRFLRANLGGNVICG